MSSIKPSGHRWPLVTLEGAVNYCKPVDGQYFTRSQAVARIADHTVSQHLLGSHDVIGQVTI